MPQEEKPSAKPTAEVDSSITEQMYSEAPPIAEARWMGHAGLSEEMMKALRVQEAPSCRAHQTEQACL